MAFMLTLAFVNGCATVISKMINYRCTKYLGTNNGSLVNYVVASVLSFVLLAISSKFSINLYSFSQAPWWAYLGGALRDRGIYYFHDHTLSSESYGIHHSFTDRTAYCRNFV